MTLTLVAAVAANGVIGRDGGLPWHLPEDLRHLKALTLGHAVVMGRRTYDSIGRPLPGRTTVVVASRRAVFPPEVLVAANPADAVRQATAADPEVFVLGGASVYAATLPLADSLVISHVHAEPDGDTRFPDVDWSNWRETSRASHDGFDLVAYSRDAQRPR